MIGSHNSSNLVIVIGGPTGVGKTSLSLFLSQNLPCEIISADSLQIYRSINILNNKASKQDQEKCKHHMLDIVDIEQSFYVTLYRDKCLDVINNCLTQKKFPLIVGGTNYYIESLIYDNLIEQPSTNTKKYNDIPNIKLWEQLKLVDPKRANQLHHNDRRKVVRSLQISSSGMSFSSAISSGLDLDGSYFLRFKNILFIWLTDNYEHLDSVLRQRLQSMMDHGAWDELQFLYQKFLDLNLDENDLTGVFQIIGFKQFLPCLKKHFPCNYEDIETSLKNSCFEETCLATLRYAKKQNRWIQNRILKNKKIKILSFNIFNSSFNEIGDICLKEIKNFKISDQITSINKDSVLNLKHSLFHRNLCEICNKVIVGELPWIKHLKSKKHYNMKKKQRQTIDKS